MAEPQKTQRTVLKFEYVIVLSDFAWPTIVVAVKCAAEVERVIIANLARDLFYEEVALAQ